MGADLRQCMPCKSVTLTQASEKNMDVALSRADAAVHAMQPPHRSLLW